MRTQHIKNKICKLCRQNTYYIFVCKRDHTYWYSINRKTWEQYIHTMYLFIQTR